MSKIVGIGNALLDHEYQLTETQLIATGLTKGNMTLVNHQQQIDLLNLLKKLELQPSKQASGGSAANSIYAAACLGSRPFYACRVGNDTSGQFYLQDLHQVGIQTSGLSIKTNETTGSCLVMITPDGERTMQTFLGTSADICEQDIDFSQLTGAEWLYLEGYLAMSPSVQSAIQQLKQQAKQQNVKVAVSFADPAVVKFGLEGLTHMLAGGVDVIFCNAEEACLFTKQDSHLHASQALLQYCQMAVVTNGSQDTLIVHYDEQNNVQILNIPTPKVSEVLDTNGAGDNFAGAFLHSLSQGYHLATCGKLASEIASQIVCQYGARLTPNHYQDIAKRILNY